MGLRAVACPCSWQLHWLGQAVQVQVSETAEETIESSANRRVIAGVASLDLRRDLGVPAAIRIGEMIVQLVLLSWLNPTGGPSLSARLSEWDAVYYGNIATHWYPHDIVLAPDGSLQHGYEFAFYPLYPLLAGFTHLLGFSTKHALLVTAALCGIAASIVVHLLARRVLGSRRAGYLACALIGALPMAIALQMGYAESLYIAVTAGALLAAFDERWWLAGVLTFAAGLTRPSGLLVPLVIPLAAWAVSRARSVRWSQVTGATVLGFAAAPAFWIYLSWRTGVSNAWFVVEKHGWQSRIDWGRATLHFLHSTLQHPNGVDGVMGPATAVVLIGFLAACVVAMVGRNPPPIVVLSILSVAIVLGSTNYWHSKPRLLLAAFPLIIVIAAGLLRLRNRTAITLVVAGVLASAWFGAYALDVWQYAV